jgi:exoribonuclease II
MIYAHPLAAIRQASCENLDVAAFARSLPQGDWHLVVVATGARSEALEAVW